MWGNLWKQNPQFCKGKSWASKNHIWGGRRHFSPKGRTRLESPPKGGEERPLKDGSYKGGLHQTGCVSIPSVTSVKCSTPGGGQETQTILSGGGLVKPIFVLLYKKRGGPSWDATKKRQLPPRKDHRQPQGVVWKQLRMRYKIILGVWAKGCLNRVGNMA